MMMTTLTECAAACGWYCRVVQLLIRKTDDVEMRSSFAKRLRGWWEVNRVLRPDGMYDVGILLVRFARARVAAVCRH
jgi:hypothetical protein